jgi:hypothetical protein
MVEAASGEGRMGRAGLVSLSYARTMANGSGTATPPWVRTEPPPGLYLRMVVCWWRGEARGKHACVGRGQRSERQELVRGEESAVLACDRPQLMVCAAVQLAGGRVVVVLVCACVAARGRGQRAAGSTMAGHASAARELCGVAAAGGCTAQAGCRPQNASVVVVRRVWRC